MYYSQIFKSLWLLDFSSISSLVHQPNHSFSIILGHNPFFLHIVMNMNSSARVMLMSISLNSLISEVKVKL